MMIGQRGVGPEEKGYIPSFLGGDVPWVNVGGQLVEVVHPNFVAIKDNLIIDQ
jgi:hypothetical protein